MAKTFQTSGKASKFAPRKASKEAPGRKPGALGRLLKAVPLPKIFGRTPATARYPLESRWHAVSIVPSEPCPGADAIGQRRRFLPSEAPRLPLPECPRPHACTCAYRHFTDRRSLTRRGFAPGFAPKFAKGQQPLERRLKGDRRADDCEPATTRP
jgi:hypothetical protein